MVTSQASQRPSTQDPLFFPRSRRAKGRPVGSGAALSEARPSGPRRTLSPTAPRGESGPVSRFGGALEVREKKNRQAFYIKFQRLFPRNGKAGLPPGRDSHPQGSAAPSPPDKPGFPRRFTSLGKPCSLLPGTERSGHAGPRGPHTCP